MNRSCCLLWEIILCIAFSAALKSQTMTSGYITVGPDKVFYDMAGEGSAIVLIHDGNIHREVWDDQMTHFSKDHKVIRYDRRGYGKTPAATVSYTNEDDLHALFTQLKIEKACLMGMSAGGRLAVDFTLRYPEKVTSLVLVGAVVGGLSYTSHFTDRGGRLPKIDTTDWAKYLQQSRLYYVTEDPYTIYAENKKAKEKAKRLILENPRQVGHARIESAPVPAYKRLHEVKVPTLILVGEHDIPDVHAHAGALNAGIHGSRRDIIRNAAHLPPLEQPESFNKIVADFLVQAKGLNQPKSGSVSPSVTVPVGSGEPVLVDGIFSPGEWTDAVRVKVTDSLALFFKQYKGHAFIGIHCPSFISKVSDVFISVDDKVIYQLHCSAQLGERHRTAENPNPEIHWGDTKGWYANEARWDAKKLAALVQQGKSRDEGLLEAIYPYDGFEYQIRLNKFNSVRWHIRFWITHGTLPTSREYIFPAGTKDLDTTGWMVLEFDR